MARLIPADKGTHFVLGAVLTLLALLLAGPAWAVAACVLAAIGREVYGWRRRAWRMAWADACESLADIGATLAGGAVVLAAHFNSSPEVMTMELILSLLGVAGGLALACWRIPGGFMRNLRAVVNRDGGPGEEREP